MYSETRQSAQKKKKKTRHSSMVGTSAKSISGLGLGLWTYVMFGSLEGNESREEESNREKSKVK